MDTRATLTVKETAEYLRVSEKTVRRAIAAGRLPSLRPTARKLLIPKRALDRLLAGETNGREREAAAD